jgi:hypothetical protein
MKAPCHLIKAKDLTLPRSEPDWHICTARDDIRMTVNDSSTSEKIRDASELSSAADTGAFTVCQCATLTATRPA